ncbi:MAG TPA: ATP-dependent DNA helicase PcrA, partial [Candidatus Hydrogenedentes bacterium]|nr:ATP-dependent DNA helicase PcrA [Candidatus Hydrogenedentota bacterium]
VDEYQDTNHAQYMIARTLAGDGGNLFVVGDEDQSIYSWRGANLRNILDFEKDFPDATVYRLEQNYRSTARILDVANAVVSNNVYRLGKRLWTQQDQGGLVRCFLAEDGEDEARFVVEDLVERGLSPGDVAVLYRTNGQSRLFEEALRRRGIAYRVVGGIRFYARKEIKDVLAFLRLLVNPADDEALRRIVNVPPRGIGGATLEQIEHHAATREVSLFQALREVETDAALSTRARNAILAFTQHIEGLQVKAESAPVAGIVDALLDVTGYRDYVRESDEKDSRARLENVDEFLSACAAFDTGGNAGGLMAFLQELALLTDVDDWDADAAAVTLMTCHSAKGLEFDHVYLVGLEEGLLPHATALDDEEELEEERRLCYVAMTRARKTLVLAAAAGRLMYGKAERRRRSRFLAEIPPRLLDMIERKGAPKQPPSRPGQAAPDQFKVGTRVRHAKFGSGAVMYTAGAGAKRKVRIRFDSGQTRMFVIKQAPIEILKGGNR